jgi:hypothetical protein
MICSAVVARNRQLMYGKLRLKGGSKAHGTEEHGQARTHLRFDHLLAVCAALVYKRLQRQQTERLLHVAQPNRVQRAYGRMVSQMITKRQVWRVYATGMGVRSKRSQSPAMSCMAERHACICHFCPSMMSAASTSSDSTCMALLIQCCKLTCAANVIGGSLRHFTLHTLSLTFHD